MGKHHRRAMLSQRTVSVKLLHLVLSLMLRLYFNILDVYFDRNLSGFSDEAMTRAKTAQMKMEHYYKVAVDSAVERNTRCALKRSCMLRSCFSV